jgi:hypothetical protein
VPAGDALVRPQNIAVIVRHICSARLISLDNADFARALPDFHQSHTRLAEQLFRLLYRGAITIALEDLCADRCAVSPKEEAMKADVHFASRDLLL